MYLRSRPVGLPHGLGSGQASQRNSARESEPQRPFDCMRPGGGPPDRALVGKEALQSALDLKSAKGSVCENCWSGGFPADRRLNQPGAFKTAPRQQAKEKSRHTGLESRERFLSPAYGFHPVYHTGGK